MLREMFGPSTLTYRLRGGLEEAAQTHRAIAGRVAGMLDTSSTTARTAGADPAGSASDAGDIETEMTALADTQLRYEADARLLQAAYTRLRTAIRDRG